MGVSEYIKKGMRKVIVSPFFLVFGALVIFSLGLLFGLGYLRYYVDGDSINRRAIHSTLVLNLWENPDFLPGELNLIKGNQEATISEDGNTMILSRVFSRDNSDLFFSNRTEDGWSKPIALSGFINTGYEERAPHLSRDGKWLLFQSDRPDTRGGFDLYLSQKLGDRWSEPINLGDAVNTKYDEGYASFSPDGLSLYFSSNRPSVGEELEEGEEADWDVYRSDSISPGIPEEDILPIFGEPIYLEALNSEQNDWQVSIPANEKQLYLVSDRDGGVGGYDIWISRFFEGDFLAPENLGKPINSSKDEMHPTFADRGTQLVYVSNVYSIHPRALKYYSSFSREVLSRFDYALLRNVLLILLLLVLAGVAIHYLLKFLLDSELKLLPRCLIASFLLHLILAALTGSLFLTSKIEETLEHNLSEMTVNINALAQESISVAIRESVASLPRVEAPTSLEQVEVEVPLKSDTPINEPVNPYPDVVSVKRSVSSEKFTQVRQAPARIEASKTMQRVAQLNFTNSNLMMESPEGVIQSGEGDQIDPNMDPKPVQERFERSTVDLEPQPFEPIETVEGDFEDTVTEAVQSRSVATASRSRVSGNLSSRINKGIKDSEQDIENMEVLTSSPGSLSFAQEYGTPIFLADVVMEVDEEDEKDEEEIVFRDFLSAPTGRSSTDIEFGFDQLFNDSVVDVTQSRFGTVHGDERFTEIKKRDRRGSLERVAGLLMRKTPLIEMEDDSELEIPEHMLEDDEESLRPVF